MKLYFTASDGRKYTLTKPLCPNYSCSICLMASRHIFMKQLWAVIIIFLSSP